MIMKILIIKTFAIEQDFSISTYNTQGLGLATELSRLGHECALVYYAKKGNGYDEIIESNGFKIKVYHIEGINILKDSIFNKKLYELCDEYDVLQPSECDQITSWIIYKKYPQKTVIYHGPYNAKFTKKYNLRSKIFDFIFLNRAHFKHVPIITKSYLAEESLKKRGFKNITTIGVGLNPYNLEEKVLNVPNEITILKENKLKNDIRYILFIGVITNRKNLKFVLAILNELVNIKKHKNYKLIIIGRKVNKEKKYFEECMSFIKEKKLQNNIIIFPKVEQKYLKYIYKCSDIFLLPTQYDIFGMVYLEAMYFGVPIITTFCGGSSLLIEDGKTGFIRNIEKSQNWTSIIIDVLENDLIRNQIANEAEKKIKDNYLWSKLVRKFEKVYKEIIINIT